MAHDINLDGGEISLVKAIGFGAPIRGDNLLAKVGHMPAAEVIDLLKGLIALGYVSADPENFKSADDLKRVEIYLNSGYARELKEALDPRAGDGRKPRRVRRE